MSLPGRRAFLSLAASWSFWGPLSCKSPVASFTQAPPWPGLPSRLLKKTIPSPRGRSRKKSVFFDEQWCTPAHFQTKPTTSSLKLEVVPEVGHGFSSIVDVGRDLRRRTPAGRRRRPGTADAEALQAPAQGGRERAQDLLAVSASSARGTLGEDAFLVFVLQVREQYPAFVGRCDRGQ